MDFEDEMEAVRDALARSYELPPEQQRFVLIGIQARVDQLSAQAREERASAERRRRAHMRTVWLLLLEGLFLIAAVAGCLGTAVTALGPGNPTSWILLALGGFAGSTVAMYAGHYYDERAK